MRKTVEQSNYIERRADDHDDEVDGDDNDDDLLLKRTLGIAQSPPLFVWRFYPQDEPDDADDNPDAYDLDSLRMSLPMRTQMSSVEVCAILFLPPPNMTPSE